MLTFAVQYIEELHEPAMHSVCLALRCTTVQRRGRVL